MKESSKSVEGQRKYILNNIGSPHHSNPSAKQSINVARSDEYGQLIVIQAQDDQSNKPQLKVMLG